MAMNPDAVAVWQDLKTWALPIFEWCKVHPWGVLALNAFFFLGCFDSYLRGARKHRRIADALQRLDRAKIQGLEEEVQRRTHLQGRAQQAIADLREQIAALRPAGDTSPELFPEIPSPPKKAPRKSRAKKIPPEPTTWHSKLLEEGDEIGTVENTEKK
jgi:hypothetical protein